MWILRGLKEENRGKIFYIFDTKHHRVSRKDAEITLSNDQSISRLHAQIYFEAEKKDKLVVVDMESKYGTFLLGESDEKQQLVAKEPAYFKSGSIIQFGLQWNVFRLEYMLLVVCPSTLTSAEKAMIKQVMNKLNGEVISDWVENATHLTMNKLTLTIKVVCALGHGKPIVTTQYWKDFMEAVEENKELPSYESYIPPLMEKALNKSMVSFKINEERRKVFAGKTFITCCPSQKARIRSMVLAAGGKIIDFSECKISKEQFCDSSIVLMRPHPNDKNVSQISQSQITFTRLLEYLKENDIRTVGESEIGISVVYCSAEKYCNPQFDFNSDLMRSQLSVAQSAGSFLVPETQNSLNSAKDTKNFENMVIPESVPLLTPANKSRNIFVDSDDDSAATPVKRPNRQDSTEKKVETSIVAEKSQAAMDISRDVFASIENPRPSSSRRQSTESMFSNISNVSSGKKRPLAFVDDDEEENAFNFCNEKSKKSPAISASSTKKSESTVFSVLDESNVSAKKTNDRAFESVASVSKRPRISNADPDDLFSFPTDKKQSNSAKRRASCLEDETDSSKRSNEFSVSKRVCVDDTSDIGASFKPAQKLSTSSWSQEIKKINSKFDAIGFVSRENHVEVKKEEDDEAMEDEETKWRKGFQNATVIESKSLIKPRVVEPVAERVYDDGPNFKKFRKNKVPRANVTKIIGKMNLKVYQAKSNEDLFVNFIEEEEEREVQDLDQYFQEVPIKKRGRQTN